MYSGRKFQEFLKVFLNHNSPVHLDLEKDLILFKNVEKIASGGLITSLEKLDSILYFNFLQTSVMQ